ncbi:hypothetical protein EV672_101267 [Aquabacterium commune]|uniref:DUF5666 domain-containing protein n=1 Tax=Aquabacterium commune TaxID=70586 RepID=A0A4R6RN52_9BURK|nr:DUF5666 domain-containing protein [Aquabacterium commune]TDP88123.1 hypothetical protein EV672_101267 [Aquabacterium commune]
MTSKPPRAAPAVSGLKQRFTACALGCLLALSACGGGGGGSPSASNGVGVGGTGSAAGPVTGFGSIIVNDIRFDDSTALIFDDDDTSKNRSDIKLGMLVDVRSGVFTDDATTGLRNATATQIIYGSSLKGVVTAKGASSITVLGQVVNVTSTTVFDGFASGLASVTTSSPNNLVEVHALFNPSTSQFTATRIERKSAPLSECKLTGLVNALSTNAQTFFINGFSVAYAGATRVSGLAEGQRVKVRLAFNAGNCTNNATRIDGAQTAFADNSSAEVEGFVSNFISSAGAITFKVNGVPVSATTVATGVADGIRVEAEGVVRNGVLVASKVERKDLPSTDSVRLFGSPSGHAPSTATTGTFIVQGQTVYYDTATTRFDNFSDSNTFNNPSASLEVRGAPDNSGTVSPGTVIIASEIKLKN